MTRPLLIHTCLALLCAAFLGCELPEAERPLVLVTVPPQAWLVNEISGPLVDVHVLVPPGAHPGSYSPGQGSMRQVSRADLYLALGVSHFPFEAVWVKRIQAQNSNLHIVPALSDQVQEDPHLWTGTEGARQLARVAVQALGTLLPNKTAVFEANYKDLLDRIQLVEQQFKAALQEHQGDRFYVFHPAWGNTAREFGIEQVAIEEHAKEPSAHRLGELIKQAQQDSVRYILVQPQFSQQGARTIADAIGAELLFVDPLGDDWEAGMAQLLQALSKALVKVSRP